ncbi:hypothetical protein H8K90_14520 [Winogradskyella echinorum]|uniref:Uncharacterized protein n=1 Tax=Winogradskyella echinorum TaxID=538189 RepID=A0ABR6Y5R8_9FLAO|nr:hypothetical protein [Winogradskyella echinorum]MBC3847608.1 hypothetical protein [Winogradskyella echinorum]MBC5751956.1 hypothetical protein [Winogradskyella echinorum]
MKFNRRFYDSDISFKSISKKKLVLSILLGLVSAIFIYSFFYVLREAIRLMSLGLDYLPKIISEGDRNLYNLFCAAISFIFGNSIAISSLFSRPQNTLSRRNVKRGRILNDQIFLGFNFMYWFTKIWILVSIFSMGFMDLPYLSYLFLPSILLIIVLYLESWKTLILIMRKNRWKIQVVHLLAFVILTFTLSRIDIVDYKSIDKSLLNNSLIIDIPSSLYKNDNYKSYNFNNLVFKMEVVSNDTVGLYNYANQTIELYEVYGYIREWKTELYFGEKSKFSPKLRANKDLPIKYIKQFELELLELNQRNVIYEISNDDELTSRFYNNQLMHRISPSLKDELPGTARPPMPPPIEDFELDKELKFMDTLRVHISSKVEIGGLVVPLKMLSKKLKNHINKSTIIEYIYTENVTYQDYINVLSAHKKAVWELRATENFDEIDSLIRRNQFSRDEKLNNERDRIKEKYPLYITERFE